MLKIATWLLFLGAWSSTRPLFSVFEGITFFLNARQKQYLGPGFRL